MSNKTWTNASQDNRDDQVPGSSCNVSIPIPENKIPTAGMFDFNQKFKSRFAKMCLELEHVPMAEATFKTVNDVDFVFIVEKNNSQSMTSKMKSCFVRQQYDAAAVTERARELYLAELRDTYKLNWVKRETSNREYYLIQLSFIHLGLMMELLGYQWQLRYDQPEKKAYKTFYFRKRNRDRYKEYELGNNDRDGYGDRFRYDLCYYFLQGATERMQDCVRVAEKEMEPNKKKNENAKKDEIPHYSIVKLFNDDVFDDWMVLHDQVSNPTKEEVNERVKEMAASSTGCCISCSARCCFPCITCQMKEYKADQLSKEYPAKKEGRSYGAIICTVWRTFWYRNLVASTSLKPRNVGMGENQRPENTREYIARIGSLRNAFLLHSPNETAEDKAANFRHLLPLNRLSNYFGEKIGLYFGWIELLIISLTFPAIIGVVLFLCGIMYYAWEVGLKDEDKRVADDYVSYIMAKACDNYATPVFAAIMVTWGTTFYELWNRRERWYAFMWRVQNLEKTELERPPQYHFKFLTRLRESVVTAPLLFLPSVVVTLFFIFLVFFSVYFINVMMVLSITYCPKPHHMVNDTDPAPIHDDSLSSTLICNSFSLAQVLANSVSMFVLDLLYTNICYWLTNFEGHTTQSQYTDALILKLFTFRFFNYYLVLFYIAFGIATKSVQYPGEITGGRHYDYAEYGCGQQPCMAFLTRQLLSVIVTQPFLNSLLDNFIPALKRIIIGIREGFRVSPGKDNDEDSLVKELEEQVKLSELSSLDRREFTAEEYTDKLIVYGALIMFSVALPPAPFLALFIMRIDLSLDLGRLMRKFRRPLPTRAQDIGMWGHIVNFLTYSGIITNPLIVVLTSSWGSSLTVWWKFLLFLICEHAVLAIRILVTVAVPDIPKSLVEQEQIHKLLKDEILAYQNTHAAEIENKTSKKIL